MTCGCTTCRKHSTLGTDQLETPVHGESQSHGTQTEVGEAILRAQGSTASVVSLLQPYNSFFQSKTEKVVLGSPGAALRSDTLWNINALRNAQIEYM